MQDKIEIYLHLIWATWDRLPLLSPEIERDVHRVIASEATKQNCTVLALNGVEDHVHLLVKVPATFYLPDLLQSCKGVSSHAANGLQSKVKFKWRGTYAAFSVSRWNVRDIMHYIERQKSHHAERSLRPQLEWNEQTELPDPF